MSEHICPLPLVQAGASFRCPDCSTWWFVIARGKTRASARVEWVSNSSRNPYPTREALK